MKIRMFTNEVAGGWHAENLAYFLGGSEECVVLLCEALVRHGFDVHCYHTLPDGWPERGCYQLNGVNYASRQAVEVDKKDILITFKENLPWIVKYDNDAAVKIHWSSDIEIPWNTNLIDVFVCISNYHYDRTMFVPWDKKIVIPHGIDIESLQSNATDCEEGTVLYCSSPDRGLWELLTDWPLIVQKNSEKLKLKVAYGFENMLKMGNTKAYVNVLKNRMKLLGVEYLGTLMKNDIEKEYYKADYWILPLNNPDAELFCLNAVKSRYCGANSIVKRIGALRDTVGTHIPYNRLLRGDLRFEQSEPAWCFMNWDTIVKEYWIPLFEKHLK